MFEIASWACTLTMGGLLFFMWRHRPYVLVKPSFMALACIFLHHQVSCAINATYIQQSLAYPWEHFILSQFFPPVALIVSSYFFNRNAKRVYQELISFQPKRTATRDLVLLSTIVFSIVIYYLEVVPFHKTGFYAIFNLNPLQAELARERSYQLLGSALVGYSLAILRNVVAPFFSCILVIGMAEDFKKKNFLRLPLHLTMISALLMAVSLTGERGPAALLFISAILVLYLTKRVRVNLRTLVFGVFVVFTLPAILTLYREGNVFEWQTFGKYFLNIVDRAFGRAVIMSVWHVDYVQTYGDIGFAGMGNIAQFLGLDSVDIFNVVGLKAIDSIESSIGANTNFVVSYFTLFGIASFFISIPLLCALDSVLLLYRSILPRFLAPCVATTQVAVLNVASTTIHTLLFTNGFLLAPLFGIFLSHVLSIRLRTGRSLRFKAASSA